MAARIFAEHAVPRITLLLRYEVRRYGTRHWAVYDGAGELVCVTLYLKGATEVVRRLKMQRGRP